MVPYVKIDPAGSIILTIRVIWLLSTPFVYFMVPAVIWWVDRQIRTGRIGIVSKSRECSIIRSISLRLALVGSIALVSIFVLFLNFHQLTLGFIENNLWRLGFEGSLPEDFNTFPVSVVMLATHLLLPITTVLIAYYLYSAKLFNKTNALSIVAALWLVPRIGLVIAVMRFSEQRTLPDNRLSNMTVSFTDLDPGPVFYGLNGLWASSILFGTLALISVLVLRYERPMFRHLAVAACLSPILVLIWGAFQIGYAYLAIDYVITAYLLGWLLSAFNRSKSASVNVATTHQVSGLSDVAKEDRIQSDEGTAWLPGIVTASPSLSKTLRACKFIVIAVIPAFVLKWIFYNVLGFRLDGSVASWTTIWAVSIMLGLFAFAVTSFSERRDRATQVAVVAFVCTFAIMIFNWNVLMILIGYAELPAGLSFVDTVGVVFTVPIIAFGASVLIATVVLDNHRWTWPFWACWMFIYIFVHAFGGSGYQVNDVSPLSAYAGNFAYLNDVIVISKFQLFPWINLSVIIFVFLFAIPAYLASDRCQMRMHVATPIETPA